MLTLLFLILTVAVFGKLIIFAFKMTWGLAKLLFTFIFLFKYTQIPAKTLRPVPSFINF